MSESFAPTRSDGLEGVRSPGFEFDGLGETRVGCDVFAIVGQEFAPNDITNAPNTTGPDAVIPRSPEPLVGSVAAVQWAPLIRDWYVNNPAVYDPGFPRSGIHCYTLSLGGPPAWPDFGGYWEYIPMDENSGPKAWWSMWNAGYLPPEKEVGFGINPLLNKIGFSLEDLSRRIVVCNYWFFAPWWKQTAVGYGLISNRMECVKTRFRPSWSMSGWIGTATITASGDDGEYDLAGVKFIRNETLRAFRGGVGSWDQSGPWLDLEMPGTPSPDVNGEICGEIVFGIFGETQDQWSTRTGWSVWQESS